MLLSYLHNNIIVDTILFSEFVDTRLNNNINVMMFSVFVVYWCTIMMNTQSAFAYFFPDTSRLPYANSAQRVGYLIGS